VHPATAARPGLSDIDERRFTVLPPDLHNFEGDHNGIGCEEP
jgi:hypothetical protein